MTKQKIRLIALTGVIIFISFISLRHASANGSATVSWIAPITNEDDSTPVDVTGYRIFYSTSAIDCTAWDTASDQTTRQAITLAANHVDVTEAATLKDSGDATKRGYTFSTTNNLTSGQTYNFAVVAKDGSGNLSKCGQDSGNNKTVSKEIFHTGNLRNIAGAVGVSDLSILAGDYGKPSWCRIAGHPSDINGDCLVNFTDLSIFAGAYGQS
jgi:hypothetical protein